MTHPLSFTRVKNLIKLSSLIHKLSLMCGSSLEDPTSLLSLGQLQSFLYLMNANQYQHRSVLCLRKYQDPYNN